MGPLLRLISLRRVRERPGHALAAVVAVMVGVGTIVAVQLITAAISRGVAQSFDAFTGRTALRIDAGEGGLVESVLETVRAVPGVEVAVPVLTSPAYVVGTPGDVLTVLGVDLDEETRVRRYTADGNDEAVVEDPLVFLSQPNSLILTRTYADRHGLRLDDRIELQTPQGKRAFVIRGLLAAQGPAVAFGGNLAVMDYQAAQLAFAKEGRLDEIDVVAGPGRDVAALTAAIGAAVGTGLHVEPPGARGAEIALATRSVTFVFLLLSALTTIIAVFLVYNVVSLMVAQRGEEIAQLRALGVRRRESVRLILLEAGVVGVVGALAGLVFGVTMAHGLVRPLNTSVGTALFVTLGPSRIAAVQPHDVVLAVLVGVLTALTAAWVPARQATRFVPVVAARRGAVMALRQARLPSPWWGAGGLLLGGLTAAVALASGASMLGPVTDAIFVVAFAVLAPAVVRVVLPVVARLLRPLGPLGRLAVLNVMSTPQRSALTVAPLMVAVALVIVIATMIQSFRVSLDDWMAAIAPDDLQVASVSQDPARAVLLDESLAAGVEALAGVARVHRFRMIHGSYEGRRVVIESNEYEADDPALGQVRFRLGEPRSAFARLVAGQAVVVSENFAAHFRVGPGDVLRLPTPRGLRTLPIVATATNYNGDQGSIMMASLFLGTMLLFLLGIPSVSARRPCVELPLTVTDEVRTTAPALARIPTWLLATTEASTFISAGAVSAQNPAPSTPETVLWWMVTSTLPRAYTPVAPPSRRMPSSVRNARPISPPDLDPATRAGECSACRSNGKETPMARWIVLALVCALAAPALADADAEAKKVTEAFKAAMDAGKVDAVLALYADDAFVIWPGQGEEAHGKAEIEKVVRATLAGPTVSFTPVSSQATMLDDTHLVNVGRWETAFKTPDGKRHLLQVRTSEVLVKKGGAWLYQVDHASVGTPPPPKPAPRGHLRRERPR